MKCDPQSPPPIPARLLTTWLEDNARFIEEDIARRNEVLREVRSQRNDLLNQIRRAELTHPVPLGAVDAAIAVEPLGDMVTILVQAIYADDSGHITPRQPIRVTGIAGHEMSQSAIPIRLSEECALLATARSTTIADTSFWSILMEVNKAVTLREKHPNLIFLAEVVDRLQSGSFIDTIRNRNVIAMSKRGEARWKHNRHISAREAWGSILDIGEYTEPARIADALEGNFGIHQSGFTTADVAAIRDTYENRLGVTYYKPHEWSRAYRIEAQLSLLKSPPDLMPILSAIHKHTATRPIVEPWPQFIADYAAKHISAIAKLYGARNQHRTLIQPSRT